MKQNPNFLLRDVADSLVIVPVGAAAADFPGMITLNATGKYLWELLETEQTMNSLVEAMLQRYEVTEQLARNDIEAFLKRLRIAGALLEND